jgi:hypothetical protein
MSKLNGTKKLSKKETRKIVFDKLSNALAEYKGRVREKKLNNNLKKISKLLATDIVKAHEKQNGKPKKSKQKASVNQTEPAREVLQN